MSNFSYKVLSNKGGRPENQDFAKYLKLTNEGFVTVLADGLGGHKGGRLAAHLAVETIIEIIQQENNFSSDGLLNLQQKAHKAIVDGQKDPNVEDMRSTIVLLVLWQGQALWLHCGDSRLYHIRNGQIIAQTRDHSVPGMFVAADEITYGEIRSHPDRNKILRSLGGKGTEHNASVCKKAIDIEEDDIFLLCTDGFWEYVLEQEMLDLWCNNVDNWLQSMQQLIIDRAEKEHDNYTACVIHVREK